MGYSCSAIAGAVLDEIQDWCSKQSGMTNQYGDRFFTIGRENKDGAITGSVEQADPAGNLNHYQVAALCPAVITRCRKVGTFRIEPSGFISKFPGIDKKTRFMLMQAGVGRYQRAQGIMFMILPTE